MKTTIAQVIQDGKFIVVPAEGDLKRTDILCKPDCLICGGVGFVRFDVPVGHPKFGKLERCPNMDVDAVSPAYAQKYGLSKKERELDWPDVLQIENSNIQDVAEKVKSVFDRGYGWIYLWGDFGIGKTLLLQIVAACGLRDGKESAYIRMAEIMDMLRDGYKTDDYSERMGWLQSLPILCIDEFERVAEKQSNGLSWVAEKRFVLMDVRYVSAGRGDTLTIMAGNQDPSKLSFDDGYLWDRIRDKRFMILRVSGKSLRPGLEWDIEIEEPETNSKLAWEDGRRQAMERGE